MLIEAVPILKKTDEKNKTINFPEELSFERSLVSKAGGINRMPSSNISNHLTCSLGKGRLILDSQSCSSFVIYYSPQIGENTGDLLATFTIPSFETTVKDTDLSGIRFIVRLGNPDFVRIITTAKYLLFFTSLVFGILYARRLKLIPTNMRVVEQTLILRQSILLVFYNDPLFAMIFYSPNHFQ